MGLSDVWQKTAGILQANGITDIEVREHLERTSTLHLPQAQTIISTLSHLQDSGLVEAYLRGSFSCGEADQYSDIDLFLVVEPEELENVYDRFCDHFGKEFEVVVSCHDRLVADYGGIGFMFTGLDQNKKPVQFDLYLAMKGVPPKHTLVDCPRVFVKDPEYCWFQEGQASPALPEKTQAFIDRFTKGNTREDKVSLLLQDLMVTLSIMRKHLTRGQSGRALNDNNHSVGVCVELLQEVLGRKTFKTSLYIADELIAQGKRNPDAKVVEFSGALEGNLLTPPSFDKVQNLYGLAKQLVMDHYPGVIEAMSKSLQDYEQFVIPRQSGAPGPRALPESKPS